MNPRMPGAPNAFDSPNDLDSQHAMQAMRYLQVSTTPL